MRIVSLLVLPLILLLALAGQVSADTGEGRFEIKEVDGYKVKLSFVDGDVQLGPNTLHILILDAQGQPVDGMAVNVVADHYAESAGEVEMNMDGMKSTSSPTDSATPLKTVKAEMKAGTEPGEYAGEVELAESGHWMVKVMFPVQQIQKSADFDFEIGSGSKSFIIWIFGGISALIIIGAVIARQSRRKKVVVGAQA